MQACSAASNETYLTAASTRLTWRFPRAADPMSPQGAAEIDERDVILCLVDTLHGTRILNSHSIMLFLASFVALYVFLNLFNHNEEDMLESESRNIEEVTVFNAAVFAACVLTGAVIAMYVSVVGGVLACLLLYVIGSLSTIKIFRGSKLFCLCFSFKCVVVAYAMNVLFIQSGELLVALALQAAMVWAVCDQRDLCRHFEFYWLLQVSVLLPPVYAIVSYCEDYGVLRQRYASLGSEAPGVILACLLAIAIYLFANFTELTSMKFVGLFDVLEV